jgi:glycerol-3-phosphate acyltransferase PlsY
MGILGSLILMALIAYLWGSIPTGYWMGKLLRGPDFDIRQYGSHKIGATNVLRTLGKVPAAIVFVLDLSKGVLPTLLAALVPFFNGAGWGPSVAGLAALLGHCYPIFIGFKGGRGVLTASGALLVISPMTFLIALIGTVGTITISRFVSLGSIAGSVITILCGISFYIVGLSNPAFFARVDLAQLLFMIIAPALVIIFHADNIGRLLTGKERKIGQKEAIAEGSGNATASKQPT